MKPIQLPKIFEQMLQESDLPVLVDFWAEWCGPCRMVSSVVERIASEYKDRLLTVKVNVDKKKHIAARYEITSIPTIIFFIKGKPVMRHSGAVPYEDLKAEIDKAL